MWQRSNIIILILFSEKLCPREGRNYNELTRPVLAILLQTSALLTTSPECLSLYQAENYLTLVTQMSRNPFGENAIRSLSVTEAPGFCILYSIFCGLCISKQTSDPTIIFASSWYLEVYFFPIASFPHPKPIFLITAPEENLATFIIILYSKPLSKEHYDSCQIPKVCKTYHCI